MLEQKNHQITNLIASLPITSERLRDAFLHIPRDCFISSFYERTDSSSKEPEWKLLRRHNVDTAAWLNKIYQNTALVISLGSRGHPESSSSQPSIMARMLETLDIRPGMRVLEIGTGSGYNAALIAYLTGDPRLVTTIDIDEHLIEQAIPAITQCVGQGTTVVAGNGLQGYPAHAPYDRIIATGSVEQIPPAWIEQLAYGGQLLVNLRSTLANCMLLITKQSETQAYGIILPYHATFMDLHDGSGVYTDPPVPLGEISPVIEALPDISFYPTALQNREFLFWLFCHFPTMQLYRIIQKQRLFLYLADFQSKQLVQFLQGRVRGSSPLWKRLQEIEQSWFAYGQPKRQDYAFWIKDEHQSMQLANCNWQIV